MVVTVHDSCNIAEIQFREPKNFHCSRGNCKGFFISFGSCLLYILIFCVYLQQQRPFDIQYGASATGITRRIEFKSAKPG